MKNNLINRLLLDKNRTKIGNHKQINSLHYFKNGKSSCLPNILYRFIKNFKSLLRCYQFSYK
ncbi:hypothetical protein C1645_785284 [Glomus cerebriforme]|uniref:Uncharacterized protein n=1 Tax=Glomus cerebriforme TaxID=658196 RepID=A0A397SC86_9GLOM|nr:hypothetical protein C1645_785284 [Glomus cerebriforme]